MYLQRLCSDMYQLQAESHFLPLIRQSPLMSWGLVLSMDLVRAPIGSGRDGHRVARVVLARV
jgi:hypothetical protein